VPARSVQQKTRARERLRRVGVSVNLSANNRIIGFHNTSRRTIRIAAKMLASIRFLVRDFEQAELKDSLFGPDLPSIQQQTFEGMIENLESILYNFIKSE
jgi:hypothetical protein